MHATRWVAHTYVATDDRPVAFENAVRRMREETHLVVFVYESDIDGQMKEQSLEFVDIESSRRQ